MTEEQLPYHQQRLMRKNDLLPKLPTRKERKPIPKVSPKRARQMAEEKAGGDSALDRWFEEMRHWLTGKCSFCNGRTTWKNEELWRCAIAHLLAKSKFPSVATNNNNWVELCWDCHTGFDNGMISWEMLYDSHEWLMLRSQLEKVLPFVAPNEQSQKIYSKLKELVYGKTM